MLNDYKKIYALSDYWFKQITLTDTRITVDLFSIIIPESFIEIINSINNQGVEAIDCKTFRYVRKGVILGFDKMSRAERLFLVTYCAVVKKQPIYLQDDVRQLTDHTIELYFNFFKKIDVRDYINIICNTDGVRARYILHGGEELC